MIRLLAVLAAFAAALTAQPPELGQGWLAEFNLAARQLTSLAEATPAEKFGWRPAEGVRSIGEVYMHIALGNYWLLERAGVTLGAGAPKLTPDLERQVTEKPEVIRWLKESIKAVKTNYPKADLEKKVQFFGQETTSGGVFLRILVHNHEHMGQSVAYARMNGIAPPWSKKGGE
ncbi:MAG: DinB family protein [Bryobacteraceae bacterium]|nr:DinB family protein [Bryobacteraceae bacterium]